MAAWAHCELNWTSILPDSVARRSTGVASPSRPSQETLCAGAVPLPSQPTCDRGKEDESVPPSDASCNSAPDKELQTDSLGEQNIAGQASLQRSTRSWRPPDRWEPAAEH